MAVYNSERSAVNFIPRDPSIFSTSSGSTGISSEDEFAARTSLVSSSPPEIACPRAQETVRLVGYRERLRSAVPRVEQPSPIEEIILLDEL